MENIYPENALPESCCMVRERIITHLKDGKKEVVLYRIFKKKWGKETGKIANVLHRSEYGIEVLAAVAFLVYGINIPLDIEPTNNTAERGFRNLAKAKSN